MSCTDKRAAAVAVDAPPDDLSVLVTRIKENRAKLHGSIWTKIQIGGDLIVAKKTAGHGRWLTWVRENCGLGEREAQNYMRLAAGQTVIEAHARRNPQHVSDLTLRSGLRLIATARLLRSAVATVHADSSKIRKQHNFVARDCMPFLKALEAASRAMRADNATSVREAQDQFNRACEEYCADRVVQMTRTRRDPATPGR